MRVRSGHAEDTGGLNLASAGIGDELLPGRLRSFMRPGAVRAAERLRPLSRVNLSDQIAQQIELLISDGEYQDGDRLPPIREMARNYGVGPPTVREGLKKLEACGVVTIRPGCGVYVSRVVASLAPASASEDARPVATPLLGDLLEAHIALETHSVALAARQATREDIERMRRLLTAPAGDAGRRDPLSSPGMAFHRAVGIASGNPVLAQLLDALRQQLPDEQRRAWARADERQRNREEHQRVLEAIEAGDDRLAGELMRAHLEGMRQTLLGRERPAGPD